MFEIPLVEFLGVFCGLINLSFLLRWARVRFGVSGLPEHAGNIWLRVRWDGNKGNFIWTGSAGLFIDGKSFARVRALWGPLKIFGKPQSQKLLYAKKGPMGLREVRSQKVTSQKSIKEQNEKFPGQVEYNADELPLCLEKSMTPKSKNRKSRWRCDPKKELSFTVWCWLVHPFL